MRRAFTLLVVVAATLFAGPHADNGQLAKWSKKWQHKLNMDDWTVTICLSPRSGLRPNTLGHSVWDLEHKTASIKVLRGEDYENASNDVYHDQELTVIHELVHIKLAEMGPTNGDLLAEERVVVSISEALVGRRERKETY